MVVYNYHVLFYAFKLGFENACEYALHLPKDFRIIWNFGRVSKKIDHHIYTNGKNQKQKKKCSISFLSQLLIKFL
jgi:hypothetical protein